MFANARVQYFYTFGNFYSYSILATLLRTCVCVCVWVCVCQARTTLYNATSHTLTLHFLFLCAHSKSSLASCLSSTRCLTCALFGGLQEHNTVLFIHVYISTSSLNGCSRWGSAASLPVVVAHSLPAGYDCPCTSLLFQVQCKLCRLFTISGPSPRRDARSISRDHERA